jgi:hypothetical protein
MTICDSVQQQLAEAGVEAAEAEDIARHLEGCDDCSKFLADLQTIDAGLLELTAHDAPDALVAETLAAVRAAGKPEATPARPGHRQRWLARGLAGGAVIAASLALTLNLIDPALRDSELVAAKATARDEVGRKGEAGDDSGGISGIFGLRSQRAAPVESAEQVLSESENTVATGSAEEAQRRAQQPAAIGDYRARGDRQRNFANERLTDEFAQTKAPESEEADTAVRRELDVIARVAPQDLVQRGAGSDGLERGAGEAGHRERFEDRPESSRGRERNTPVGAKSKSDDDGRIDAESKPRRLRMPAEFQLRPPQPPESDVSESRASELEELNKEAPAKDSRSEEAPEQQGEPNAITGSGVASGANVRGETADRPVSAPVLAESLDDEKKNRANLKNEEVGQDQGAGQPIGGAFTFEYQASENDPGTIAGIPNQPVSRADISTVRTLVADRFLQAQRSLEGLSFQEPAGYWANTYIPGDPAIRLLEARLAAWDRTALGQFSRLEQDVRPGIQPFDAPADAALAVTMASDTAAIDGPTRLRVQIGLKGAERLGGRRPAMNIGLVVDLRSLGDAESGSRIRALISALERARQPGDRFSLTVAGAGGGLLVAPEQFRHGPLQVALERMFNSPTTAGEAISLPLAMNLVTENVRTGDDPQAVLGSSLVMLVTGASLEADVDALERMAHNNAVGGVPLSVVSLAGRDDLAHIDRLVAAGQGNRRILDTAQAADALVDRELHSASRAVARALRLRIRLAPGVKLVSVLDSRRLGEPQAAQVREAEVAIDQRLARNLGIEADRGDDEQGIQMVIPNFFAGDSHVVLLDVVAERPGPVADVTVRYKDVVNLNNGVAQASVALDDAPREAGPLERNVLKNLVALEFAEQTRLASRELMLGNFAPAQQRIIELRNLIQGLRFTVPGWQSDPDLAADVNVLSAYDSVLATLATNDPAQSQLLADSLQVAAHRKLQPDVPR